MFSQFSRFSNLAGSQIIFEQLEDRIVLDGAVDDVPSRASLFSAQIAEAEAPGDAAMDSHTTETTGTDGGHDIPSLVLESGTEWLPDGTWHYWAQDWDPSGNGYRFDSWQDGSKSFHQIQWDASTNSKGTHNGFDYNLQRDVSWTYQAVQWDVTQNGYSYNATSTGVFTYYAQQWADGLGYDYSSDSNAKWTYYTVASGSSSGDTQVYMADSTGWADFSYSWATGQQYHTDNAIAGQETFHILNDTWSFKYLHSTDNGYWKRTSDVNVLFAYNYGAGKWYDQRSDMIWHNLGSSGLSPTFIGDSFAHNLGNVSYHFDGTYGYWSMADGHNYRYTYASGAWYLNDGTTWQPWSPQPSVILDINPGPTPPPGTGWTWNSSAERFEMQTIDADGIKCTDIFFLTADGTSYDQYQEYHWYNQGEQPKTKVINNWYWFDKDGSEPDKWLDKGQPPATAPPDWNGLTTGSWNFFSKRFERVVTGQPYVDVYFATGSSYDPDQHWHWYKRDDVNNGNYYADEWNWWNGIEWEKGRTQTITYTNTNQETVLVELIFGGGVFEHKWTDYDQTHAYGLNIKDVYGTDMSKPLNLVDIHGQWTLYSAAAQMTCQLAPNESANITFRSNHPTDGGDAMTFMSTYLPAKDQTGMKIPYLTQQSGSAPSTIYLDSDQTQPPPGLIMQQIDWATLNKDGITAITVDPRYDGYQYDQSNPLAMFGSNNLLHDSLHTRFEWNLRRWLPGENEYGDGAFNLSNVNGHNGSLSVTYADNTLGAQKTLFNSPNLFQDWSNADNLTYGLGSDWASWPFKPPYEYLLTYTGNDPHLKTLYTNNTGTPLVFRVADPYPYLVPPNTAPARGVVPYNVAYARYIGAQWDAAAGHWDGLPVGGPEKYFDNGVNTLTVSIGAKDPLITGTTITQGLPKLQLTHPIIGTWQLEPVGLNLGVGYDVPTNNPVGWIDITLASPNLDNGTKNPQLPRDFSKLYDPSTNPYVPTDNADGHLFWTPEQLGLVTKKLP